MSINTNNDDCYFYFYSTCSKGSDCPFRHCEAALGTETVCCLWIQGRCFNSNCRYRHMESRINRATIPCYWENQPGGCRKPHCVFFHQKFRNVHQTKTSELIFPTGNGKAPTVLPDPIETSLKASPQAMSPVSSKEDDDPDAVPVQPLVVSFNEAEESDNESVSSTPVKMQIVDGRSNLMKRNLSANVLDKNSDKDFGIKTLEQIRMEKIHKESDGYYATAYDAPALNAPQMLEHLNNKECYPPKSDFISAPMESTSDKSLPAPIKEKLISREEESDLRRRLLSKRNVPSGNTNPTKRATNFAKQPVVPEEGMNFKVKTLAEIRKEKENRLGNKSADATSSEPVCDSTIGIKRCSNNGEIKVTKKMKITRKLSDAFLKLDAVNTSAHKRTSEDDSEKKENSNTIPCEKADTNGCRKNLIAKTSVKNIEAFLRRPKIQSLSASVSTPAAPSRVDSTSSEETTVAVTNSTTTNSISKPLELEVVLPRESSSPVTDLNEKGVVRSLSVDEFEQLLNTDEDMNMEDLEETAGADDILREIEQFLDS